MTEKPLNEELSDEELEETNGEPLPDREAMSILSLGDAAMFPPGSSSCPTSRRGSRRSSLRRIPGRSSRRLRSKG
jgi:hypothetical protein